MFLILKLNKFVFFYYYPRSTINVIIIIMNALSIK